MMRGCLTILVLAAAFVIGAIWFGGPPLAGTVIEASLTGSGLTADELDVNVSSDPPLGLVTGRVDRVSIHATGVGWGGIEADSMDLDLVGVDLFGRTAASADGTFEGVGVEAPGGGPPILAAVDVSGPADAAATTVTIDRPTVERLALAAFEAEFNTRPEAVALVAPDEVRVTVGGRELPAHLEISEDGAIVAKSALGTVSIMDARASLPLVLTGLRLGDDGLVLNGTLDVTSLLR
jgi:hypothetical protein